MRNRSSSPILEHQLMHHLNGIAKVHWKLIGLEMRLHKHIHIHKGIITSFRVLVDLMFSLLCFLLLQLYSLVYTKHYGITLILFGLASWPYSNLILSHASFVTVLLTTNNLMLYLLQSNMLYAPLIELMSVKLHNTAKEKRMKLDKLKPMFKKNIDVLAPST